jgi:hypothetical protein
MAVDSPVRKLIFRGLVSQKDAKNLCISENLKNSVNVFGYDIQSMKNIC